MHLRDQGVDDDDGGVGRVRRARVLSGDNGGVSRGRGIYGASKGSETTTEAAVARQRAQVIYNDDRVVGGGRLSQRLQ